MAATQTANNIADEQKAALEAYAETEAALNEKVKEIYDLLKEVSQRWEAQSQGYYLHRSVNCLIAARALASNKRAVYL